MGRLYHRNNEIQELRKSMSDRIRSALAILINEKGISRIQIAQTIDAAPSYISHFMAGSREMSLRIDSCAKIATEILNCSLNSMFFGQDGEVAAPKLLTRFMHHASRLSREQQEALGNELKEMAWQDDLLPSQVLARRLQEYALDHQCESILQARKQDTCGVMTTKDWFPVMASQECFPVTPPQMIAICISFNLHADYLATQHYVAKCRVSYIDEGEKHFIDSRLRVIADMFVQLSDADQQRIIAQLC